MQKPVTKILAALFALVCIVDVLLLAFGKEDIPRYIKPFLVPLLAVTVLSACAPCKEKWLYLLMTALLFHTAGDILLLFDHISSIYFMLGLVSFLIGHVFYILLFYPATALKAGLGTGRVILQIVIPSVAVPACIVPLIGIGWPMNAAMIIYATALFVMVTCGVAGALAKIPFSPWLIAGAMLFFISDLMIALSAFVGVDFPLRHSLTMGTYLIAQACLVSAALGMYGKPFFVCNSRKKA